MMPSRPTLFLALYQFGSWGEGARTHSQAHRHLQGRPDPAGTPGGQTRCGHVRPPHYLGDRHNGEHVSFAEGKILLSSAMEVVFGNALCTGRPGGLQDRTGGQVEAARRLSPPTCPPTLKVRVSWPAFVSQREALPTPTPKNSGCLPADIPPPPPDLYSHLENPGSNSAP